MIGDINPELRITSNGLGVDIIPHIENTPYQYMAVADVGSKTVTLRRVHADGTSLDKRGNQASLEDANGLMKKLFDEKSRRASGQDANPQISSEVLQSALEITARYVEKLMTSKEKELKELAVNIVTAKMLIKNNQQAL